ncbi:hypothetical protein GQ457_18G000470 [Hibiscus cannabinus]
MIETATLMFDSRAARVPKRADILALATRDVIALSQRTRFQVRQDQGHVCLTLTDLVALSGTTHKTNLSHLLITSISQYTLRVWTDDHIFLGAQTIGFSHCSQFSKRIYKFKSKSRIDPTLDPRKTQQM